MEEQIVAAVRDRSRALVEKDVPALERMLAETFVYTNASGAVLTKDEYLDAYVRNADVRWELQELADLRVDAYGDAAVVLARVHDVFVAPGMGRFDGFFRTTFVFVREGVDWRCVAGQTTTATTPPSDA
jgi:hypothetical protein